MAASIQPAEQKYDVGGVLLARPFQITRLGHFGLSLVNFDAGVRLGESVQKDMVSVPLGGPVIGAIVAE